MSDLSTPEVATPVAPASHEHHSSTISNIDPGADYNPSMDDAAGLSAYREAAKPPADPAGETPEASPVATTETPSVSVPSEELSPEDKRLERILTRVTRLDEERGTLQKTVAERDAELSKLRARAEFADKYESELRDFNADPEKFFKRVNWDQEKIRDYIVNGPSKVDATTSRLANEQADLKARLEKYEQAEAARAHQARIADYKATLPKALEPNAAKYPLTLAFYDSPATLADAVFSQMESAYRAQNKEITADEAATALEQVLTQHAERLSRARSKPGTPGTAPLANKPNTPTLTNSPPASASVTKPNPSDPSDDDLLAEAVRFLKSKKIAA